MSGIGDKIRGAVMDMIPGDAGRKINAALGGKNDGHTTSGMDAAMQAQADKLHPTNTGAALRKRPDGSLILPLDGDYKP